MDTCRPAAPSLPATAERMNLVVVGHVDHGKSTVVGRLLADTGSLPEGRLEQVQERCRRHGKQFEFAFLLDALADEQSQGITIDSARIFFATPRRHYLILDAPGHIEFLKNMVTGASHAEAALLVIDAEEGVQENSRRHGYMLGLLGVGSVLVLINKMDRVGWRQEAYELLVEEYSRFLSGLGVEPAGFLPVSGLHGDNVARPSERMGWFEGGTVLEALDRLEGGGALEQGPFRMYVQDVYKFTRYGDDRRIVVGTIDSGTLGTGNEVIFYPSAKKSRVRSLESFGAPPPDRCGPGEPVAFTLTEQVYLARGELAAREGEPPPRVATRLRASVFWLGAEPLRPRRDYLLRVGTARVTARLEEVERVLDAGTLSSSTDAAAVERNTVAECVLRLNKAVAFDEVERFAATSRFVLVDDYRIAGGGIIREALEDPLSSARERRFRRSSKWIRSLVPPGRRAERYGQRPTLVLVSGPAQTDRKGLARALEARLFEDGRHVYFLGIGSVVHGLDSDLEGREDVGQEHVRRLAEVANIMLDAGMIFVVSAANLSAQDVGLVGATLGPENVLTVWFGEEVTPDAAYDLHLPEDEGFEVAVARIKGLMVDHGVLFSPW